MVFFTKINEVHQHDTRSSDKDNLTIPQSNTSQYGSYSIKTQTARTWNTIQQKLTTKNQSKNQLHSKLINLFLTSYTQN